MSDTIKNELSRRTSLSICVPCYNEELALPELFKRLASAAGSWNVDWEVVLIDDGSVDRTWKLICSQNQSDLRWRGIRLSRNFGHQAALSAGLAHTQGQAVAVIDADLQDPPEEIGRLLAQWRQGYEVVYAVRQQRKEGLLKRTAYELFYRVLRRLANIKIPLDAGDFCLMDRRVVDIIISMPEKNPFIRGLRAWVGFRQIGVPYERQKRVAGEAKYKFKNLVRLALDGILSFSLTPMRLAIYLGFIISLLAFVGVLFILLQRIFAAQFTYFGLGPISGFATIVISILFMGGVQLVVIGILGEYLGRMFDEVKHRPRWIEWETVGLREEKKHL